MPIYEFRCKNCDRTFEELVFSKEDEEKVKCPYCGSEDVEKEVSVFASLFGGSSCGGGGFFR